MLKLNTMVIANAISKVAGGNQPADRKNAATSNAKSNNGNNSTSQESTNNQAQSTTSGPDAGTAAGQAVGRLSSALNNGGINAFSMPGMAPPAGNANQMAQMMGAGSTSGSGSVPAPATGGGGSAKPRNRGGGSGGGGGGCGPGGCPNTNDGGGSGGGGSGGGGIGGGGSGGGGVGGPGGSNTNPGVNPGKPVVGADRTFENNGQKLTLPGAGNKVADVDGNASKEQLLASGTKGLPTLAIFSGKEANGTYWCGPCKNQKSKVDGLPSQLEGKVNVAEVAASGKGSSLSEKMKIDGYPSYVLFDAKGNEISRGSFVNDKTVQEALNAGNANDAILKEAAIKDAEAKKKEEPKPEDTKPEDTKPEDTKAEDPKATDPKASETNGTKEPQAEQKPESEKLEVQKEDAAKANSTEFKLGICGNDGRCPSKPNLTINTSIEQYKESINIFKSMLQNSLGINEKGEKVTQFGITGGTPQLLTETKDKYHETLKKLNTFTANNPNEIERARFEKLVKEFDKPKEEKNK
jgi:thiol-disulfide isomerase/thioredoxin